MLGTTVETSPSCYQPELRPDLQVKTISVEAVAGRPNVDEYVAAHPQSTAPPPAGPFEVQFTDGGGGQDRTRRRAWRPAPRSSQRFLGPLCTTGTATVTADPVDQVDDYNRANNSLNVVCSGTAGRARGSRHRLSVKRRIATLNGAMKTDIHPEYVDAHVRCTCGNEFMTRSTKNEIHVEICSACHPFYTGKQKLVDTGGRVERFQRRVAKGRRAARTTTRTGA